MSVLGPRGCRCKGSGSSVLLAPSICCSKREGRGAQKGLSQELLQPSLSLSSLGQPLQGTFHLQLCGNSLFCGRTG